MCNHPSFFISNAKKELLISPFYFPEIAKDLIFNVGADTPVNLFSISLPISSTLFIISKKLPLVTNNVTGASNLPFLIKNQMIEH